MLDLVKYTWANKYGYWIPVAWMTVLTKDGDEMLRTRARSGKGNSMSDFQLIDRVTIPEEMRLTGKSSLYLAYVCLYDKLANEYTAEQFIAAMRDRMVISGYVFA